MSCYSILAANAKHVGFVTVLNIISIVFCNVTQRRLVSDNVSGLPMGSIFKGKN